MMFVGLIGFTLIRQYQTVRSRQAERTSALVEAIDAARTEERNLLARELHDVLAHHLSVILLQCMAYGESDEADEVRLALDRIAKSLEGAEGELALLTSVMSEGEEGQMPALVRPTTVAKRLKSTLAGSNFPADFKIDQDADELPPITQRTITRAMQEGVTNIIRYAKPGAGAWWSFTSRKTPSGSAFAANCRRVNVGPSSRLASAWPGSGSVSTFPEANSPRVLRKTTGW